MRIEQCIIAWPASIILVAVGLPCICIGFVLEATIFRPFCRGRELAAKFRQYVYNGVGK